MNKDEIIKLFDDDNHSEFLKFDRIEHKLSKRPDLHAFLLLEQLTPDSTRDLVCAAGHDIIYLDVTIDDLVDKITPEQVVELRRCGVMMSEYDSLSLFV